MTRALVLACALGCCTAAAATPAAKKAPVAELKRDFASGEFERVIKKADVALKAATDPLEIAQLQLWRGQALLALGKEDLAKAAFTRAVEASGEVELDAQRASPDALRAFEQARATVPATLAVKVAGGDATVKVDGKEVGPAPLVLQLPGGKHVVEARGPGELVARREVELLPGRRLEAALELKVPEPGPAPPPVVEAPPQPKPEPQPVGVEPRPVVASPQPAPASPSRVGLAPLIGGLALGAAGGVMLWQARVMYDALNGDGPALTPDQEASARSTGPLLQALGWTAVGVGAAAAVAGVVMLAFAPSSPVQVSLFVTPGASGFTVSARFF